MLTPLYGSLGPLYLPRVSAPAPPATLTVTDGLRFWANDTSMVWEDQDRTVPVASGAIGRPIALWEDVRGFDSYGGLLRRAVPELRPWLAEGVDGKRVAQFYGGQEIGYYPWDGIGSEYASIFAVYRYREGAGLTAVSGGDRNYSPMLMANGDIWYSRYYVEAYPNTAVVVPPETWGVTAFIHDQSGANTTLAYHNNIQTLNVTGVSWGPIRTVGSDYTYNRLYGDIAEFLLYTRAVTETERQSITLYLTSKWGIPG